MAGSGSSPVKLFCFSYADGEKRTCLLILLRFLFAVSVPLALIALYSILEPLALSSRRCSCCLSKIQRFALAADVRRKVCCKQTDQFAVAVWLIVLAVFQIA